MTDSGRIDGERSLLIVEDDSILRETLTALLTEAGWAVAWAINGEDALRNFRADPANVILTDIVMPQMTGIEFIQAIREFDTDTPIVILTGYSTYDNCLDALRAGATDLVTKPFRNDELVKSIARAFAHRHGLVPPEPTGTLVSFALTMRVPLKDLQGEQSAVAVAEALFQVDSVCRQTGFRRRRLAIRRSLEEALLLAADQPLTGTAAPSGVEILADFDDKRCRVTIRYPEPIPHLAIGATHDPLAKSPAFARAERRVYLMRSFCDEVVASEGGAEVALIIHHPRYQRPLRKGA